MPLNKSQILDANDREKKVVDVPEWGDTVILASMSGSARDDWEMWVTQARKDGTFRNVRARLLAACLVDDQGARLFASDADVVALGEKNGRVLDRLFDIARSFNGLSDGDIEALKKRLESAQKSDSGTN
jgi:hypothetical protein